MNQVGSHVAIVGGGVIGLASAYYLRKAGYRVTVIEQSTIGSGCSYGNCGLVCPSDVMPLASPGAVRKTLGMMWRRRSPFRIKPTLSPRLWLWFLKFALRCNARHQHQAAQARWQLLESSMQLYQQMMDEEQIQCEWQNEGLLYVFQDASALQGHAVTDDYLKEHFQLQGECLDSAALIRLEPSVLDSVAGAWFYKEDAHLRPDRLMSEWKRVLLEQEVDIRERCALVRFRRRGLQAVAIETTGGEVEADHFVMALGAITPKWEAELGTDIPIQPGKGYSLTYPRPENSPKIPMLFPQHKVAMTPMDSGYRLGSTMEFSGYDTTIHAGRLNLLREGVQPYLRQPDGEGVEEEWYGWRPMIYNGIPIIDTSPRLRNVLVATGHNMLGLSMGPATGKLVSEMISGVPTHVEAGVYQQLNRR
ncbi:MAG: FAD-dependent oxidoreductase [Planctomycetota bacterium]|nr:FAD-dependent oxidoreductase [Planctomycetota bacterium]